MKYLFIEQHKVEFAVRLLCEVLEVSESGYYTWRKRRGREPARRQKEDQELTVQLESVFEQSHQTYGIIPWLNNHTSSEGV